MAWPRGSLPPNRPLARPSAGGTCPGKKVPWRMPIMRCSISRLMRTFGQEIRAMPRFKEPAYERLPQDFFLKSTGTTKRLPLGLCGPPSPAPFVAGEAMRRGAWEGLHGGTYGRASVSDRHSRQRQLAASLVPARRLAVALKGGRAGASVRVAGKRSRRRGVFDPSLDRLSGAVVAPGGRSDPRASRPVTRRAGRRS